MMLPTDFDIFLAVFVDDQIQANTVLVGDAVRHQGRDRVQGIKPAARLVDRFADVVGREMLLELVMILERVMPLRVRHGTGVEPAIDHFRNTLPGLAVFLESDLIDRRPMQSPGR